MGGKCNGRDLPADRRGTKTIPIIETVQQPFPWGKMDGRCEDGRAAVQIFAKPRSFPRRHLAYRGTRMFPEHHSSPSYVSDFNIPGLCTHFLHRLRSTYFMLQQTSISAKQNVSNDLHLQEVELTVADRRNHKSQVRT